MAGRVLFGLVGVLVLGLFSSGLVIFLRKPLRNRADDRYAARFIAEVTAIERTSGYCPTHEELETIAERQLCPTSKVCLYYDRENCAVGYHVRGDEYFEYRVRDQRWYSSDELRDSGLASNQ
ncbi:MAG: hypothetical protein H6718_05055 [Polyangiaceae bacterium]|nr:hypothetical protein [Myxococcales bacterium]MCB9584740.1 hypothetical protein [Polyangiaceae bacterium]